jgi:hypothetical protein
MIRAPLRAIRTFNANLPYLIIPYETIEAEAPLGRLQHDAYIDDLNHTIEARYAEGYWSLRGYLYCRTRTQNPIASLEDEETVGPVA